MNKLAKIGIVSAVLAATSLTAVTPAAARDNGGVAVVAGIIGLGLGAAIASDHPHYRQTQYYYDRTPQPYYSQPQYGYGGQPYGYGQQQYAQPQYGYGNSYAYGSGYARDRGYGYESDGQRAHYYDRRRGEDVRQRDRDRDRSDQRRSDRDDDDYYGY